MDSSLTASLHELVHAMDGYADRVLVRRFGVDRNLLAFLAPLAGGELDVTRLAESLNLTKAAVSKRAPLLQRDGWLVVSADPAQRRRVVLGLTPKAAALVAEAEAALNARFATLVRSASVDPRALDTAVRRLVAAVHALDPDEELR